MHNYIPENYHCPFCLLRDGIVNDFVESRRSDVIYEDDETLAFICSWQFVGTVHEGHALVVPKVHYENIYELPDSVGGSLASTTRLVATAMRSVYEKCEGVTTWQNNGPAADQTVWHYHTHLLPRVPGDSFTELISDLEHTFSFMEEELRAEYAKKLRDGLAALD